MTVYVILVLALTHFVADFVLQSEWMAMNKSHNWVALTAHVSTYTTATIVLLLIYILELKPIQCLAFGLITFVAHFVTDALTSRATSYLWRVKENRAFFNVIGFDQLLHTIQLVLAYQWVIKHV